MMALNKEETSKEVEALSEECMENYKEAVELRHPLPMQNNLSERNRHSEPINLGDRSGPGERKCFERRRKWTATKQESIDLPEEFGSPTEDNVFAETEKSIYVHRSQTFHQRSMSMPATLPDVVPETAQSGNTSPDVLVESGEVLEELSVKSILNCPSVNTENMLGEQEKKKSFEGTVRYELMPDYKCKRKKSVTFEKVAQVVRLVSAKGKEARSHYCSSGYGSQSDTSQVSQNSNQSSEQGSVMSDDVLERSSFEAEDLSDMDTLSLSSTKTDGIIDGKEEENSVVKAQCVLENHVVNLGTSRQDSSEGASANLHKEHLDEIERWRLQMSPKFNFTDMEDLPNLSIFNNEKDATFCCAGSEDPSDLPSSVVENTGGDEPPLFEFYQLPQPSEKSATAVGTGTSGQGLGAGSPGQKTSPTTKEECQRELFKRLFEERMLKYDPKKENVTDLLDWVRTNIGEALTPSPKSPFLPARGSQLSETFKVPQGVIDALQTGGSSVARKMALMLGTEPRERGCAPTVKGRLAAPFSQHGPLPFIGSQAHPQVYPVLRAYLTPQYQPRPAQGVSGVNPFHAGQLAASQSHQHVPSSQPVQGIQPAPLPHRSSQLIPFTAAQSQVDLQDGGTHVPHGYPIMKQPGPFPARAGVAAVPQTMQASSAGRLDPPPVYQVGLPTTVDEQISLAESSGSVELGSGFSTNCGVSYMEQLVNISQCSDVGCTDITCVMGKKSLHSLQEALKRGPSDLGNDDLRMLKLLCGHFNNCDLPNCRVHWCRYMSLRDKEKTCQELVGLLSYPLLTLIPPGVNFETFVKLDPCSLDDTMPQEWKDWLMLYPLSQSYTIARVVLLPPRPNVHWVVKMTSLQEEGNQLNVYKKLRGLKHNHIIHHLWAAASESAVPLPVLVVCSEYLPGISVRELLDQHTSLGCTQTRHYMLQLLSAVQQLHQLDIVYLNWTCSNLLLDVSCQLVKITNFTTSVDLSSDFFDTGTVKLTLPADVVPTELLVQGGELTHNSDSWGIACVMHEMLMGKRPWHHLRHERQEDIWDQIKRQVTPTLTDDLPYCAQLMISQCLQRSPDARLSVTNLTERFCSQWLQ